MLLQRYLLKSIALPFLAWTAFLCALFFLMAFLRGIDVLLGSGAGWFDLIKIFTFLLPQFLVQVTPIAFLLGTLIGYGRLAEDGELKALQSVGTAPARLVMAPMFLGVALTAMLGLLSMTLQPWGVRAVRLTAQNLIRENAMHDLAPGVFHQRLLGLTLFVESVESSTWSHVMLFDDRVPERPMLTLATSGEVPPANPDFDGVEFRLNQGEAHHALPGAEATVTTFERATVRAALGDTRGKMSSFRYVREEQLLSQLYEAAGESAEAASVLHERFRQILMPMAFAMLGASLALIRRDGNRAMGMVITMGAWLAYYLFSRSLQSMGEQGRLLPLLAGLLPNLVAVLGSAVAVFWLNRRGAR